MSEAKANEFMAEVFYKYNKQGEKNMRKSFFRSPKYDAAAEAFNKAVNQFKLLKNWQAAGDAYLKVAECNSLEGSEHETAVAYQNAANCYKKIDNDLALKYYDEAVAIYTGNGKFSSAAKLENEIATVYESDGDKENALIHFNKAADYYLQEEATAQANKNLEKVALLSAELEKYDKAVEIFEKIAQGCIENKLLKFNAKNYLFNAGLCKLNLNDTVAMHDDLERFKDMDYTFGNSRECKLLDVLLIFIIQKLLEAVENYDVDAYTDAVYDFDQISTLDPWRTALLLKVKQTIQKAGDEAVDLT